MWEKQMIVHRGIAPAARAIARHDLLGSDEMRVLVKGTRIYRPHGERVQRIVFKERQ